MKNRRGSVLVATVLLSVVVMGMITMLYMSVIDHSNNVYAQNNVAKTMAVAETGLDIAIARLDIDNASANIGIGTWDANVNDTNGNGYPDFDEVDPTAPLIVDNAEIITYYRPIAGTEYSFIRASSRFAGMVSEMEAIVRVQVIPPEDIPVPTWDSQAGILTNGDIDLGGNFDLSGTHGAVFANGDVSVTGSCGISTGVKATGEVTGNTLPSGVYSEEGCDEFWTPIVDMDLLYERRQADCDLIFKADGKVYDSSGTELADLSSGGSYAGYSYSGGGEPIETTEAWTETIPAWTETIPAWTETIPAWTETVPAWDEIITPAWVEVITPAYDEVVTAAYDVVTSAAWTETIPSYQEVRQNTNDSWKKVTSISGSTYYYAGGSKNNPSSPNTLRTIPATTVEHPAVVEHHPAVIVSHPAVVVNHPAVVVNHPEETLVHPEETIEHPEEIIEHPETTIEHASESEYVELPTWSGSLKTMSSGTYWFEGELNLKGGGNTTLSELTVFATGNIHATSTPTVGKPATWPYFMVSGKDIWLAGGYDMGTNDTDVENRGFLMAHGDIVMRGNSSVVGSVYAELASIDGGFAGGADKLGRGTADVIYHGGLWTDDFMLHNWEPESTQRIVTLHGIRQIR